MDCFLASPCDGSSLSRLPVLRSLDFPCAVPSLPVVRHSLAFPCTVPSVPRLPVRRSLAPMSCPCAAPFNRSLARAPLPRFDAVRCLAPVSCPSAAHCAVPSLRKCARCLARSPLAAPLSRSGAVRSFAPVCYPSTARLCPCAALSLLCLDRTRYRPTTKTGRS